MLQYDDPSTRAPQSLFLAVPPTWDRTPTDAATVDCSQFEGPVTAFLADGSWDRNTFEPVAEAYVAWYAGLYDESAIGMGLNPLMSASSHDTAQALGFRLVTSMSNHINIRYVPADDGKAGTGAPPGEAFGVLGNETRMAILRTLGEADGPLPFSDLYERVEYDTTANFSYHLEQLAEHFVRQTEEGYVLRQAGKRVVKAVLSGAVTEAPILEGRALDDRSCPYCDAPLQIGYHHERVWMSCPDCPGTYGASIAPGGSLNPSGHGFIGHLRLPPAGLEGRTSEETMEAATTWGYLDFLSLAAGVCPRCGARVDRSVTVCEDHTTEEGLCDRCDCRHAVQVHTRCTNCIHEEVTPFLLGRLIATTEFQDFLTARGINPVSPGRSGDFDSVLVDYAEEVISVDPFEAKFTVFAGDDALTVAVDDDLTVVESCVH